MNLRNPKLWVAVFSATAVLWFVAGHLSRRAPAPVTTVHGRLEAIDGGNHCASCHGGWFSNMTESCLECHAEIGDQIQAAKGLHGQLDEHRAGQCSMCHSEHHGANFAMVNRQSFAMAGTQGPESFDHAFIGFAMSGKHLEKTCADCHENADKAVLEEGEFRYLGLDRNCATCHEDPHEGRMKIGCAQCHSQESWDLLSSEGHDRFLSLTGGHADLGCRECHSQDSPRSLELLGSGAEATPRECTMCHDSPHHDDFIAAVATIAQSSEAKSCAACHLADHERFNEPTIDTSAELHAASGFPIDAPHDVVACSDCHGDGSMPFAQRFPGRGADACAACHEDPHDGQFDDGPFAAEGCVGCHAREFFEPHDFDLAHHARTEFTLDGKHAELACSDCHEDPVPPTAPRRFAGTDHHCVACHEDAHRGFFDTRARGIGAVPLAETTPHGSCAHCHTTHSFGDVDEQAFDHGQWTGFVIDGAHAESDCTACHPRLDDPDETGRTFGRVHEHFGEFGGCETCHADAHDGAFDGASLPGEVEGRSGCARCHVAASFRALPHGFDHRRWTGFPLTGAHAAARCSACHDPLDEPLPNGRSSAAARGTECADCHDDPHAGQFERRGTTDCARCHRSADSFADLRFDHDRHSRFRLGEAHDDVACSKCHKIDKFGALEAVRYRPIRHECVDCHGTNRDPLKRGRRR